MITSVPICRVRQNLKIKVSVFTLLMIPKKIGNNRGLPTSLSFKSLDSLTLCHFNTCLLYIQSPTTTHFGSALYVKFTAPTTPSSNDDNSSSA